MPNAQGDNEPGVLQEAAILSELLGDVRDGILITDENGIIKYVNEAAIHMFGLKGSVQEKKFDDVCHIVDIATKEPIKSPVKQAMEEKISVGLKVNAGVIAPNGHASYLSATCTPLLGKDGKVRGCSSIFRDVTRLRRLEIQLEENQRYLRTVFSAATVGLCILDCQGNIVDLNVAAEKILRSENRGAVGRRFGDVFRCPNSLTDGGCGKSKLCGQCILNNSVKEAVAAEGEYTTQFTIAVHREGDTRPTWLNAYISTVEMNGKKNIILSLIDISERKRYEYELEQARAVAEAANAAKGQFLANMSHEIRTPISGMVGMIDLTLRTKLNDYQRGNLYSAKECSEYLLNIINDILDFSKLEAGSLKLENLRFDFKKSLNHTISIHTKSAQAKGLYLKEQFADDLPDFIMGDALRIRQILHNFLSNATKFTNSGGITVKVVRGERNHQPTLEFSIRDTGIGMAKDDLVKLFKPFSQVDGSLTRHFGGTGLGLRIAKELVDLMAGGVGVTSKVGEGSIFSFWIPCHEVDGVDEVFRYRGVYVNPEPRKKADDDDGADIANLMQYCMEKLSK